MSLAELITNTKNILKNKKNSFILVRSCENIGALSGCLSGWLDVKLSEYGRKQAKYLSLEYFIHLNKNDFNNVYMSDMKRAKDTADICFAYDDSIKYIQDKNLREVCYGKHEGLFYDGLPKEEKSQINKQDYKFPDGESWNDVKIRALDFIKDKQGINIVFTHGGFITSMLYSSGVKNILPHGSIALVSMNNNTIEDSMTADDKLKTLLSVEYVYKIPDVSELI